jgi:hypothetical protein
MCDLSLERLSKRSFSKVMKKMRIMGKTRIDDMIRKHLAKPYYA